jgi:Zn-dependent protease/Tfp pilus assembly protein PilF
MNKLTSGSFRLFQIAGITVFVHWSWFLVGYFQVLMRFTPYETTGWNVAEYVALFGIVLVHEFGHALACRQVGGKADTIVLWPLGGVAFVDPPPRPGAVLWSIAAGPLVNVALLPVTVAALILAAPAAPFDPRTTWPDPALFVLRIAQINFGLLVFNMLPVYPLDGGQILQSLLWFVLGRAKSLMVVSVIGLACGVAAVGAALVTQDYWLMILAFFVAWRSWAGFSAARQLIRVEPAIELLNQCQQQLQNREYDQAIDSCNRSLELLRNTPAALAVVYLFRGLAYRAKGDLKQAIADLSQAIELSPTASNYGARAGAERAAGSYRAAIADYSEAIRLDPQYAPAWNDLAWLLATCAKDEVRNGAQALDAAKKACELTGWKQPECLGTLAAACAEAGQFDEAITWQKKALESAEYRQRHEGEALQRLQLYGEGKPYREESAVA